MSNKYLETSTLDCIIFGILHIYLSVFSGFGSYVFANLFVMKSDERHFDESKTKVVALKPFEDKNLSINHLEHNEFGVSDVFRLQVTLFGADLLAVRSCMEIECKSLTLFENLCKKLVIPIELLPSSLHFSEDSNNDVSWCKTLKWLDTHEQSLVYVAFSK